VAISAGGTATCAILEDGFVVCWGERPTGYLNDRNDIYRPRGGPGGAPALEREAVAIAVGGGGFFALALLDDGSIWVWGDTGWGLTTEQLDGSRVALPEGRTAVAISAGGWHACAVLDDGTMVCWGRNGGLHFAGGQQNAVDLRFIGMCGDGTGARWEDRKKLSPVAVLLGDARISGAVGGCEILADEDKDGVPDIQERTGDSDGDGVLDMLDPDDDNDGVPTAAESADFASSCPKCVAALGADGHQDSDGDGRPDFLDTDDDGDGVRTLLEDSNFALVCLPSRCPAKPGPGDRQDSDDDGLPDYLDPDDDNDGMRTGEE